MSIKSSLQDAQKAVTELTAKLDKEIRANQQLKEICFRRMAQLKRQQVDNGIKLFEEFQTLQVASFLETAISVLKWKNLPETPLNSLTSKSIERQIAQFGAVCLFKHKYTAMPGTEFAQDIETYKVLPFTGRGGALNDMGGFYIIHPYNANGTDSANEYPDLVVNRDCVILSDYFCFTPTNGNLSVTVRRAIEIYCALMADCESGKKINRNWIKLGLLFSGDDLTDQKEFDKFINEVADIVEGIENNANVTVTKYAKKIQVLNTGIAYHGTELEQARKDYENALLNYLGIGTIRNENKVRKISAEFEETSDIYNINIEKRLQTRQEALDQAKKIFGTDWANVTIEVTPNGYYTGQNASDEEVINEEVNEDVTNNK